MKIRTFWPLVHKCPAITHNCSRTARQIEIRTAPTQTKRQYKTMVIIKYYSNNISYFSVKYNLNCKRKNLGQTQLYNI